MAEAALKIREEPEAQPPRSLVGWLNQIRKAHAYPDDSVDAPQRRYLAQKCLEEHYGSGFVQITKGAGKNGSSEWKLVEKAAMNTVLGTQGGYTMPIDYTDALLHVIEEEAFIFPRANVIPMFSKELQAPRFRTSAAPAAAGQSPLLAGLNFKWGNENVPAETEPTFEMANFTAWDLIGFCAVSNQWLQDAGAIMATPDAERPEANPLMKAEHYLITMFGRAAAWYAEYAFLQGQGAAQLMPVGILNAPATIQIARNTASMIKINDIVGMTSSLLPYSFGKAVWACSPTALAQIQLLAQYFINIELGGMYRVHPKPCGVLSTFPLFVTDKLPPMGTSGDLILFDPSLYVIAQRQEVVVDVSPDDKFQNNQTTYRIWLRLDGKPEMAGSVTTQDTTSKVSGYVAIK